MHLDTVCTMVDVDAVRDVPEHRRHAVGVHGHRRRATARTRRSTARRRSCAAAADAMGIDTLRVIDTGLDPVTAEREQWDDGNNTLALAPRLCVAYERNIETNAQLERAGIEVIRDRRLRAGLAAGAGRAACPARSARDRPAACAGPAQRAATGRGLSGG